MVGVQACQTVNLGKGLGSDTRLPPSASYLVRFRTAAACSGHMSNVQHGTLFSSSVKGCDIPRACPQIVLSRRYEAHLGSATDAPRSRPNFGLARKVHLTRNLSSKACFRTDVGSGVSPPVPKRTDSKRMN